MVAESRPAASFSRMVGVTTVEEKDGRAEVVLECRPEIANGRGDLHGGAIATLIDAAMARAIRSEVAVTGTATIMMTVSYLKPGRGRLRGIGRVQRAGGSVAFASAEVIDADGELVATGQGSFRLIRAKKAG